MEKPFKVAGDVRLMTVSQRQMAAAIDLSTTRINQLLNEKILVRDESTTQGRLMLFESLQNYFLSKKSTNDDANFWKERALHEKAKRELAEIKLAKERGELYESAMVEGTLAEILIEFRNKLLGMGHKLSPQLEGLTAAQMCDRIDREINDILMELAENVRTANFSGEDKPVADPAADDDG